MKKRCLLTIALLALGSLVGCGGPGHSHDFSGAWQNDSQEHWKVCSTDNVIGERAAHSFVSKGKHEATCEHNAYEEFECTVCHYQKTEILGNETKDHKYSVELTRKATCTTPGIYTFTCQECHKVETKEYTDPDAHKLGEGVVDGNITRFACLNDGCDYVKTTIDHSQSVAASVAVDDLKTAKDITLQNASISFEDSALENLGENVEISAETKTVDEIENISEETKTAIGEGTIVDFSFKDGDDKVTSFNGTLTVSIPYELKEDEDPNGIVVWYINEFGETESINAVYRDGYATFETTHFSVYVVIHMSPEELCKTFGHRYMKASHVDSTCSVHGYEDSVCTRCHATQRELLPLTTHEYEFTSKRDSTTTEEGYIEYTCKHCGDTYRTVIEKKTGNDSGFYLNLISTMAANDLHMKGVESTEFFNGYNEDGSAKWGLEESNMDMYIGEDDDGMPFVYEKIDNENGFAIYKGYEYNSSSYSKYENSGNGSMALMVKGSLGTIFDAIPVEIINKIGEIYPWLEENLINKVAVPEGFKLSINKDGLYALADYLDHHTLGEVIDFIFGEGTVDAILELVDFLYVGTIQEGIAKIENYLGTTLDKVYDPMFKVLKSLGITPEGLPETFAELVTPELKEMKILDYVHGMLPEEYLAKIPETAEAAKEMVNDLLASSMESVIEMLRQMGGSHSGGGAPVIGPNVPKPYGLNRAPEDEEEPVMSIKDIVKQYMDKIDEEFVVDSEGRFISAKMSIKELEVGGMRKISIDLDIQKGFDKAPVLEKILELVEKCDIKEKAFEISSTSYKWIEKAYQEQFPGVEFEYLEEDRDGRIYSIYEHGEYRQVYGPSLRSKNNVRYKFFDYDAYNNALREYYNQLGSVTPGEDGSVIPSTPKEPLREDFFFEVEGKLHIYLYPKGYNYSDTSVVHNPGGYGTLLGQGRPGLVTNTDRIIDYAEIKYVRDGVEYTHHLSNSSYDGYKEEGLHRYWFLYSYDSGKYYSTTGNYEYLYNYGSNLQFSLISRKEYIESSGYDPGEPSEPHYKYIFYKATNPDGSLYSRSYQSVYNTSFEYSYYLTSFRFLDPAMNDEALEYSDDFDIEVYYRSNGTIEYRPDALYKALSVEGGTISIGNMTLTAEVMSSTSCSTNVSWNIKVDDKVVKSGVYSQHTPSSQGDYVTQIVRINECEYVEFRGYRCPECGKVIYSYYNHYANHNFVTSEESDILVEPTELLPGFEAHTYTCTVCGESYHSWTTLYPCPHENLEYHDGAWVCQDCGYSIEGSEDERPIAGIEFYGMQQDKVGYMYTYAIKFFGQEYPYYYSTFSNYTIELMTVGYETDPVTGEETLIVDENGNPVFFQNGYAGYMPFYYPFIYNGYQYGSTEVYFVYVSEDELESAIEGSTETYTQMYGTEEVPENVHFYGAIVVVSNSGQATTFMFVMK